MRTAVTVNDNAPPQWRGRTGWITEDRPGGFHLVELKGGGQAVLHQSEVDRQAPAEPAEQISGADLLTHGRGGARDGRAFADYRGFRYVAIDTSKPIFVVRPDDSVDSSNAACTGPVPAGPETVTVMVGHCAVAVPASTAAALHARQASDFERILRMERNAPKPDKD